MGTRYTALTTLLKVGGKVHLVGLCEVSVIYCPFLHLLQGSLSSQKFSKLGGRRGTL